ncbi:MAG: Chitinase [Candidatus Ruthia sp. Asou_11_S2]|nr:Chitinase [Candidatus Ruthia sp. Asou_11_S2]
MKLTNNGLDDEIDKANLDASKLLTGNGKSEIGSTGNNNVPEAISYTATFNFSTNGEGLYVFKGYLCDGDPTNTESYCKETSNVQIAQIGGIKQSPKVDPLKRLLLQTAITGETKEYKSLTDEEYAKLEKNKRSSELKEAIARIITLPVSKHEKDNNGNDLGPDLSLDFANIIRVNSIFLTKFSELKDAQTSGNIDDFDTSSLTGLSDFKKSELAWQWLFPMANGHIKQFPNSYNQDVADGEYPYTYTNFLKAVAKYPMLCGDHANVDSDNANDLCKLSMSMMFAHFAQEVGGHLGDYSVSYELPFLGKKATPIGKVGSAGAMKTFQCSQIPGQVTNWCSGFENKISMVDKVISEYRQALYWVNESGCSENGAGCEYRSCTPGTWQADAWLCPDGTKYFGRGPKQLSYNYNYGPFSDIIFSDIIFSDVNVLLKNPEKITEGWCICKCGIFLYAASSTKTVYV